jgi:hypothetical protein
MTTLRDIVLAVTIVLASATVWQIGARVAHLMGSV